MAPNSLTRTGLPRGVDAAVEAREFASLSEAEKALQELADVFLQQQSQLSGVSLDLGDPDAAASGAKLEFASGEPQLLNMEARYRALVEQIPAVVFMAYLDKGIGEAYVSPQIETALGFS
ncbi:MAG TPA: hypothetical protein VGF19_02485, partial [Candidatus Acidoferrum sp.]